LSPGDSVLRSKERLKGIKSAYNKPRAQEKAMGLAFSRDWLERTLQGARIDVTALALWRRDGRNDVFLRQQRSWAVRWVTGLFYHFPSVSELSNTGSH
jgi:hypothetical protein